MKLIENQRNAVVARSPWINEEPSARRFKEHSIFVAEKIQRLSQRRSPALIPSRLTSGVTAAVANPPVNAVSATPGSSFAVLAVIDLDFELRRMSGEKFPIVSDFETPGGRFYFERV